MSPSPAERLKQTLFDSRDRRKLRSGVHRTELTNLIVTALKGRLIPERLHRTFEPLNIACRHLQEFFETSIRA